MRITSFLLCVICILQLSCVKNENPGSNHEKPNVILILTDDQGYGDLGINGNPYIHTPHLDSLAKRSTQFVNFYVDPVCAPTRSALLTGKFYLRTGIYDTFNGGAIMDSKETTLAELFAKNGYQTAQSGKWHMGDHYPSRPSDQGFIHSLHHKSGGIGQVGDLDNFYRMDSSYFDPILYLNNHPEKFSGYCADIFTEEALEFIDSNTQNPFFLYLAFNTPHDPLQVPEEYLQNYQGLDFGLNDRNANAARRVYAMVENIDYNISRIINCLDHNDLMKNTIIIFMSDNGPIPDRYNAGLRGRKGSVYEGGIKVPFFIYYPDVFKAGEIIKQHVAHVDVMPTLLDLCGLEKDIPEDIDGRSFLPLTKGDSSFFQERILYWQWNRGYPDLYNNIAVRQGDFKLVGNCRYDADIDEFELFNIREDPSESNNLISEQRSKAIGLKGHLDNWYRQVILEEGNPKPQGAIIDMQYQDVYTLTRNDAKGTPEQWKNDEVFSYWDVEFARSGFYDITFHFYHHPKKPGNLVLKMAPIEYDVYNTDTTRNEYTLRNCYFNKGRNNLEAYYRLGFSEIVSPLGLSIRASETRKERDWNP